MTHDHNNYDLEKIARKQDGGKKTNNILVNIGITQLEGIFIDSGNTLHGLHTQLYAIILGVPNKWNAIYQ